MDKSSKGVYSVRVLRSIGEAIVVAKDEDEAVNLVRNGLEVEMNENDYEDDYPDELNVYDLTDEYDDEELDEMERHQNEILVKKDAKAKGWI